MKKKKQSMPEQMEKVATHFFFLFFIFFFRLLALVMSSYCKFGFFLATFLIKLSTFRWCWLLTLLNVLRHLDSVNLLEFLDRMCIEMLIQVYALNAIGLYDLAVAFCVYICSFDTQMLIEFGDFFFIGYWIQCIRV